MKYRCQNCTIEVCCGALTAKMRSNHCAICAARLVALALKVLPYIESIASKNGPIAMPTKSECAEMLYLLRPGITEAAQDAQRR